MFSEIKILMVNSFSSDKSTKPEDKHKPLHVPSWKFSHTAYSRPSCYYVTNCERYQDSDHLTCHLMVRSLAARTHTLSSGIISYEPLHNLELLKYILIVINCTGT